MSPAGCEALLLETTGQPFYVLTDGDLATVETTLGATHPRLDMAARVAFEPAGRWSGRRPAVLLNLAAIREWAVERAEPPDIDRETNLLTAAVLCHETAHALDSDPPHYAKPFADPADQWRQELALWLALTRPAAEGRALWRLPEWFGHGMRFWRLAFHVGYRVGRRLGLDIPPVLLGCGQRYGLPPVRTLANALGDEPRRLGRLDFGQVKRRGFPRRYRKLWADVFARRVAEQGRARKCERCIIMEVLDRLFDAQAKREEGRRQAFGALVGRLLDGDDPDVAEVETVLREAGETADTLRAAVTRGAERRRLRGLVESLPGLLERQAKLRKKVEAHGRKLEIAEKQYEKAVWPLKLEAEGLESDIARASEARNRLIQTADEEAKADLARTEAEGRRGMANWQRARNEQEMFGELVGTDARYREHVSDAAAKVAEINAKLKGIGEKLKAMEAAAARS